MSRTSLKRAGALAIVVAASIGMAACGGGGVTKTISGAAALARVAATAASNAPDVILGTDQPTANPTTDQAPAALSSASSSRSGNKGTGATPASGSAAAAGAPAAVNGSPAVNGAPGAVPALKAAVVVSRRQPSAAEVDQAIGAIHKVVPFFKPSAAEVAQVGNQVCTALDQGKTFAQVSSKALDMIGAGSYSWMIPSSVPAAAVRSLVGLYCPGYTSKLG